MFKKNFYCFTILILSVHIFLVDRNINALFPHKMSMSPNELVYLKIHLFIFIRAIDFNLCTLTT